MTFERGATIIGVILAAIASTASTIQAFRSWQSRNDYLKAAVVAQLVRECDEFTHTVNRYSVIDNRTQLQTFMGDLEALTVTMAAVSESGRLAIIADLKSLTDFERQLPGNASLDSAKPLVGKLLETVQGECIGAVVRRLGEVPP